MGSTLIALMACRPCPNSQYLGSDGVCHSPDATGPEHQEDTAPTGDSHVEWAGDDGAPEDLEMQAGEDTSDLDPFPGDVGGSGLECILHPTPGTTVTQGEHLSTRAIDLDCVIGDTLVNPFPVKSRVVSIETDYRNRVCYTSTTEYTNDCEADGACNNYILLQTTVAGVTWLANLLHIDDTSLEVGDEVDPFASVGECGNIGWTCSSTGDGSHLHLSLRDDTSGRYVYPGSLLDSNCSVLDAPSDLPAPGDLEVTHDANAGWNWLEWSAVDEAADYVVHWQVGRGIDGSSASLPPTTGLEYAHTGVVAGEQYCYAVLARDEEATTGDLSAEVCVTLPNETADCEDTDGDGYGDGVDCAGADCDDSDASVHPGAKETCDEVDEDCDGVVDEGVTTSSWYRDADGDGYGSASTSVSDCAAPVGYVSDSSDCDDADASVHPGATETCDEVDEDCNGTVDDGVATSTWYRDADGDGYGTSSTARTDCAAPSGYVSNSSDCDDSDSSVHPSASESCDEVDEDCDGIVDDDSSCWVAIYRFVDSTTGAHCWNDSTTAPSTCSGYTREIEAWIARSSIVSSTWHAVQCSYSTDHIIVEYDTSSSSDYTALRTASYDCTTVDLGYIYDLGSGPAASTTPYANTCDLYRYKGTTSSGSGEHLFTRYETSTSGYTCESPARGEVLTDHACFSGTPSGC